MNRERAKELLPIIEAYAEGKTIQWRANEEDSWGDYCNFNPELNIDYRIKPEPKEWWLCWEDFQQGHEKMAFPCDIYSESEVTHWAKYVKVREVL